MIIEIPEDILLRFYYWAKWYQHTTPMWDGLHEDGNAYRWIQTLFPDPLEDVPFPEIPLEKKQALKSTLDVWVKPFKSK
jgi:hypothetical protein